LARSLWAILTGFALFQMRPFVHYGSQSADFERCRARCDREIIILRSIPFALRALNKKSLNLHHRQAGQSLQTARRVNKAWLRNQRARDFDALRSPPREPVGLVSGKMRYAQLPRSSLVWRASLPCRSPGFREWPLYFVPRSSLRKDRRFLRTGMLHPSSPSK